MKELKREYVVPLRRKTMTAPKWRRSKKSLSVLKDFMRKHMKTEEVVVCSELNEYIWNNGARNPPGKVSVTALKTDVGGSEKTIVNLSSVGVDSQVEMYKAQAPKVATEAPVQDGEAKEVETKEEVKEESDKAEEKKAETKEEVKEEVKNG